MTIWIDAQLSPALAEWLSERYGVSSVVHVRDFGLLTATDPRIFEEAGRAEAIVLTKDRDSVDLVKRRGPPPRIIWVTSGNTSNPEMKRILAATFEKALAMLVAGEAFVEIKR